MPHWSPELSSKSFRCNGIQQLEITREQESRNRRESEECRCSVERKKGRRSEARCAGAIYLSFWGPPCFLGFLVNSWVFSCQRVSLICKGTSTMQWCIVRRQPLLSTAARKRKKSPFNPFLCSLSCHLPHSKSFLERRKWSFILTGSCSAFFGDAKSRLALFKKKTTSSALVWLH